jgi:hypothetical protein
MVRPRIIHTDAATNAGKIKIVNVWTLVQIYWYLLLGSKKWVVFGMFRNRLKYSLVILPR